GKHDVFDGSFRLVGDTALGGLAVRGDLVPPPTPVPQTGQAATQFIIRFQPVSDNGTYQFAIGPSIADVAGNLMDQDSDGINGELPQDVFVGRLTIDRKPFRVTGISPDQI